MAEHIQVFTATERREDAEKMAKTLVEGRKAACVQVIGPILSTYWWKGKIESTKEWLCLNKTRMDVYNELERSIKVIHTYETPEITPVPIVAGSRPYLKWVDNEIQVSRRVRS